MTAGVTYIIRRPDGTDVPARFGTAVRAEEARSRFTDDHVVVAVFTDGGGR